VSTSAPTRGRRSARRSPVSRTSELARKRERRSFRFRLFAFVGLLLVLVLAAAYMFWLRDSSFVAINQLKVVGVDTKTKEGQQIDQAIRTAMGEMTTLHVQPEILEQELARFPRVAGSEIKTTFPDSASVTVQVRENGSIYGDGSNAMLIATDGTVLGPADGQEGNLPQINLGESASGTDQADAKDGNDTPSTSIEAVAGQKLRGRALNQALVLGATPEQLRQYVTDSRSTAEGVEVELDDGLALLFGEPTHADEKWRTAAALIADPSFDTSSYVDLSVPRRPAVSPGDTTESSIDEGSAEVSSDPLPG
jgi:cell division septal protein FtsQ